MRSNTAGVGYYNSEPRNFNRGFGRGNPKPFQHYRRHPSPQPPRRGGDPFMEAGRLAVEYLVSRGLLSSNVISGKYQNGNLRNNSGDLNDSSSMQDRDSSRRSLIDQDSRSPSRERRRLGPSRSDCSDGTHENEKERSSIGEPLSSRPMEVDNEIDGGHKDNTTGDADVDIDTVVQDSHPKSVTKDGGHSELQDEVETGCPDDASMVVNKEDKEFVKPYDATEFEETKIGADNHDKEKDTIMDSLDIQQGEEKDSENGSNSDPHLMSEENKLSATEIDSLDTRSLNVLNDDSKEIRSSKSIGTVVCDRSFEEAGVANLGYSVDQQKSVEPQSFADKTFSYEEKFSELPELEMFCSSIDKEKGEKRPIEDDNTMEGAKKAKQQWLFVAQRDEYSQLPDLSDKHSVPPAKDAGNIFKVSGSQESFTNVSLPLKGCVETDVNQGGKDLSSNSYKICDLNFMGTSDMHQNHGGALLYHTISGNRDLPADIDLSMRNNITSNEYNTSGSMRKDTEIIDLESESLEGCKNSNISMNITEAEMTTIESFSNAQNFSESQDAQDGYGFTISEFLGNEVPNCSSVQPDMNSLHNDMNLNHAEGMFSEDDPIYMSLGEIPLNGLLRAWEQPTQERNPFEP